jgi:hypothetical protein
MPSASPMQMSDRSAIDEWVRAKRWRTVLWWVSALAVMALVLLIFAYATYHATPTGG